MVSSIICFKKKKNLFLAYYGNCSNYYYYLTTLGKKQNEVISLSIHLKESLSMFSEPRSFRKPCKFSTSRFSPKRFTMKCGYNCRMIGLSEALLVTFFPSSGQWLSLVLRIVFPYSMWTVAYVKLWKKYTKTKNMTFKSMVELHSFYNHQSNSVLL